MKVYVSGPMTGFEDWNRPEFDKVAEALRAHGFVAVVPHELNMTGEEPDFVEDDETDRTWQRWMRRGLAEMLMCHAVVTLPGSSMSRGARHEDQTARGISMPVIPWSDGLALHTLGVIRSLVG